MNIPMDRDKLRAGIDELVNIAQTKTYGEIARKIKELVPEYTSEDNNT
jgi:hypothetical protein